MWLPAYWSSVSPVGVCAGNLFGQTVDGRDHRTVADREDVGAEIRVALHVRPCRR